MSTNGKLVMVAGVQFDATADAVWDKATALLATRPDAVLHVCNVVRRESIAGEVEEEVSPFDVAMEKLHAWVIEKAGSDDAPVCKQIHLAVAIGDPAAEILQTATDVDADLVIVGTHARGSVARLVLGSVADAVVRGGACSVLVARPADFTGKHKSPSIGPKPEPGHKAFHPHPAARRSMDFATYTAGLSSTAVR